MHALIESWDGSAWTVAPLPDLPGESALYGVDSLPSGEAWAVGRLGTHTLILRWQGSSWQVVPSPNVPKVATRLYGVSVASSSDAWAVGKAGRGVVIERWNGHTWSLVRHPPLVTPSILTSVLARPSGTVWVVGAQSHPGWHAMNAMSMRWSGTRWVLEPVPLPKTNWPLADQLSQLEHLARVGSTVWAAGWYWPDSGSSGLRGIIRYWADGAWQRVRLNPRDYASYSMLFGIGGESWAVGIADDETYVLLETAGVWKRVDTPNALPRDPGMNHNFLLAVDSSTGVSWAVGYSEAQGEGRQTMIMRYQT